MESKLIACHKKRRKLQEQLSHLEKSKKRLGLLFKTREIEAVNTYKGLLDCIKMLRELERQNSSVLHDEMRPLIREMHQLRAKYKDMGKRLIKKMIQEMLNSVRKRPQEHDITDAAATIESLERSNENKRTDLLITEMKIKELSEKKSLLMQSSGPRFYEGSGIKHSTSASAEGKVNETQNEKAVLRTTNNTSTAD